MPDASKGPSASASGQGRAGSKQAKLERFEESYQRLEELVAEMERGELPLEDLLVRFEEGVSLVKHCRGFLKQAQLKVEQFVELKDGQWVLKEQE